MTVTDTELPDLCDCVDCAPEQGAMHPDLKGPWLEALRSGEYVQGKQALRSAEPEGARYCCLGVLSEVAAKAGLIERDTAGGGVNGGHRGYKTTADTYYSDTMPSVEMNQLFRLNSATAGALAGMNDSEGKTFLEIADWVEENL